jgi:glycosyltransferase involved in cell wall biosynthesis
LEITAIKAERVLFLVTWYPANPARRSLFHELVDELRKQGAKVDVVVLDWRDIDQSLDAPFYFEEEGLRVFRFLPIAAGYAGPTVMLALKWLFSSWKPVPTIIRQRFSNQYDHVVIHAPSPLYLSTFASLLFSRARKYLIQWDFFPYSEVSIGMFQSKSLFRIFLALETRLIQLFDTIGCMSAANIAFLRKNYRIKNTQKVELLPIWGEAATVSPLDRNVLRDKYGLPKDVKIAVFGGTLARGRGVDDILAAASLASRMYPDLFFLIVGTGPLEKQIQKAVSGLSNARLLRYIPRDDYLVLLTACDCGIVATQRDTGLPTFPSKTIDFLRAGLPIVASVETTTDYGQFIESNNAGLAVEAGNPEAFAMAIFHIVSNAEANTEMVRKGRHLLESHFNVKNTARKILGRIGNS